MLGAVLQHTAIRRITTAARCSALLVSEHYVGRGADAVVVKRLFRGHERAGVLGEGPVWGRLASIDPRHADGRNRRILPVPARSSGGRLTERTPAVQPRRRERVKVPRSRPLPTARAFKSDHQVGPVEGMARTQAQARFCAPKLSAIRAVRATLLGERGCKPSIPMARIVSRYNQRVRQVGFEDESPW